MESLLVLRERSATFWQDWSATFRSPILGQVAEWTIVAVVGGAIVGAGCREYPAGLPEGAARWWLNAVAAVSLPAF